MSYAKSFGVVQQSETCFQVIENCGAPCYHNITFFDGEQVRFSQTWVLAWSLVSLASCAFTVATFLVDRGRFPYPERPIVYLALCYGAAAAVLILGCAHGDDIACNHSGRRVKSPMVEFA